MTTGTTASAFGDLVLFTTAALVLGASPTTATPTPRSSTMADPARAACAAALLFPAAADLAADVEATVVSTGLSRDAVAKALAESPYPARQVLAQLRRKSASGELDRG